MVNLRIDEKQDKFVKTLELDRSKAIRAALDFASKRKTEFKSYLKGSKYVGK